MNIDKMLVTSVRGTVWLATISILVWCTYEVVIGFSRSGALLSFNKRSALAETSSGVPGSAQQDRAAAGTAPAQRGDEKIAVAGTLPAAGSSVLPEATDIVHAADAEGRIHVAVFGDSLADGIWAALSNAFPGSRFSITRFSRISTGFTRARQFDVVQHARRSMGQGQHSIVVICFGSNDIQGVQQDGRTHAFMSPGWKEVIGQRMEDLLDAVESPGIAVFWVLLPSMREPWLDEGGKAFNAFAREVLARHHVSVIETRETTVGTDGGFARYTRDGSGKLVLLRGEDGVHFTPKGYQMLAAPVIHYLREVDRSRALARAAATANASDTAAANEHQPEARDE